MRKMPREIMTHFLYKCTKTFFFFVKLGKIYISFNSFRQVILHSKLLEFTYFFVGNNVFNLSYEIKNCLFFLFSGLALISHHENCNFDMPSQMSFRRVESLSSLNFKTLSTTISYQKFFLPRSSINSASKWPRIQHTSLRPILLWRTNSARQQIDTVILKSR